MEPKNKIKLVKGKKLWWVETYGRGARECHWCQDLVEVLIFHEPDWLQIIFTSTLWLILQHDTEGWWERKWRGGGITVRHVEIIPHRSHVTCVSFVFGVFSRARLSLGSVPLCLSKDESVYWGTSLVWDQTLRATDPLLHEEGYCTTRKTRPRRIKKKRHI